MRWALLAVAIISLGSTVRAIHAGTTFLGLQAGRLTPEEFHHRWLNTWALQQWANVHLPQNANLISVGETRFFPLKRRVIFDGYWQRNRVLDWAHETHSETCLANRLVKEEFSHVFLNLTSMRLDIAAGHTPPPLCDRDLDVLKAMLSDSTLMIPIHLEPSESGVGIYALRAAPSP